MPDDSIAFHLNGREVSPAARPTTTLLDWLRAEGLTGTKEGCAEGDCGACTVVLEEGATRAPINACLATLGQMHGRALRSVEGLGEHPVARLLAEADGTQCGFCTPGIVMSCWAHTRSASGGGDPHEALAGSLCRCTGYRPILDAMAGMADDGAAAPERTPRAGCFTAPGQVFHKPVTLAELLALRRAHPEAWLLAGGTDLGLRFSEHREHPPAVIALADVAELRGIIVGSDGLSVGAAEPLESLLAACRADADFAAFAPYLARLGSRQIRAMGTLGGNLGTASPIGDALPLLLALDAVVATDRRKIPVEDFLLGYRRNALARDEVIVAVHLPRPPAGALVAAEKVSRRHDQDISAVTMVAVIAPGHARVAFGGMAETARRVPEIEALLAGGLTPEALGEAATLLPFAPLSDWRGSAAWRMAAARGLLQRLWLRRSGAPATVWEVAP